MKSGDIGNLHGRADETQNHRMPQRRTATRTPTIRSLSLIVLLTVAPGCSDDGNPSRPDHGSSNRSEREETDMTGTPEGDAASTGASKFPILRSNSFLTPSRNITCHVRKKTLRCDILSGLNREPDFRCPVDWTGVYIEALASAGPVCAGDSISHPDAPILEYGQRWSRRDLVCKSASIGLRCIDTAGNGFTLARAGWTILGKMRAAKAAFPSLLELVRAEADRTFHARVLKVSSPGFIGGHGCGETQAAAVIVELSDGPSPGTYFACHLSGRWIIRSGPAFDQ